MMPLASTEKMAGAVEFAKQAGSNIMMQKSYVPLTNRTSITCTD